MRARSSPAVQPGLRTVTPRAASMRARSLSRSPAAATLHRPLGGALGARDAAFCASRAARPQQDGSAVAPPRRRR